MLAPGSNFSPGTSPNTRPLLSLSYIKCDIRPDIIDKPPATIITKAQNCLFDKLKKILPYRNITLEDLKYTPEQSGRKAIFLSKEDYENNRTELGYEIYFKHAYFWTLNTIVYSNMEGTCFWPFFPNHAEIPSDLIKTLIDYTVNMASEPNLGEVTVDTCFLVENNEINYGGKDTVKKNWYHVSLSLPPPHSMKWILAIDEQRTKIYNLMKKQNPPIILPLKLIPKADNVVANATNSATQCFKTDIQPQKSFSNLL